jgi:hypothetical protein
MVGIRRGGEPLRHPKSVLDLHVKKSPLLAQSAREKWGTRRGRSTALGWKAGNHHQEISD